MNSYDHHRLKALAYNYADHQEAKARKEEYVPKINYAKPIFSEFNQEIVTERSCPEVSRQLAQIREYKKTPTYKKACEYPGFDEYTSLIEYKIAQSSKCGGTCTFCQHAIEAGF